MDDHVGAIEEEFTRQDAFRPTCSCGWDGGVKPTSQDAEAALREHYDSVRA